MKKAKAYPDTFVTDEFSLEAIQESISKKRQTQDLFSKLEIVSVIVISVAILSFALTPIFMIVKNKVLTYYNNHRHNHSQSDSQSEDEDNSDNDNIEDINVIETEATTIDNVQ